MRQNTSDDMIVPLIGQPKVDANINRSFLEKEWTHDERAFSILVTSIPIHEPDDAHCHAHSNMKGSKLISGTHSIVHPVTCPQQAVSKQRRTSGKKSSLTRLSLTLSGH